MNICLKHVAIVIKLTYIDPIVTGNKIPIIKKTQKLERKEDKHITKTNSQISNE